jgi:hypothetical protein
MADPTTELTKEFLEMNNYLVRKETKFQNKAKGNKLSGTCSDIDIIASSPKGIQEKELQLSGIIIGEVKHWAILKKATVDYIYKKKFRFIDKKPKLAWQQLKKWIPSKDYDRVIFCKATTQEVYDYALKKYTIKIVTIGIMIKMIARFFKESNRNWTYYPERYNYNVIKNIMNYLYECYKWKDKLTLADLVWINPKDEKRWRNRFVETNAKFFEDFIFYETSDANVLGKIIERIAKKYRKYLKRELKANKEFWKYLTEGK